MGGRWRRRAARPMPPKNVQAPRPRAGAGPTIERAATASCSSQWPDPGWGCSSSSSPTSRSRLPAAARTASPGEAKVAPLMKAAGCTFKTVNAYVPKGQFTHVNSLTRSSRGTPTRRRTASTTPLGGLGLLHRAGQPEAGRPQRGARRRRSSGGGRRSPRRRSPSCARSTTSSLTARSGRRTRSSGPRSRSPPGPGIRRSTG